MTNGNNGRGVGLGLGLPPGWEAKMEPDGRMLYIDHNTKVSYRRADFVVAGGAETRARGSEERKSQDSSRSGDGSRDSNGVVV